jgi:hypothetical protein
MRVLHRAVQHMPVLVRTMMVPEGGPRFARWGTKFGCGPACLLEEGDGDPEIVGQAPV